jgi:hypothetical protein
VFDEPPLLEQDEPDRDGFEVRWCLVDDKGRTSTPKAVFVDEVAAREFVRHLCFEGVARWVELRRLISLQLDISMEKP